MRQKGKVLKHRQIIYSTTTCRNCFKCHELVKVSSKINICNPPPYLIIHLDYNHTTRYIMLLLCFIYFALSIYQAQPLLNFCFISTYAASIALTISQWWNFPWRKWSKQIKWWLYVIAVLTVNTLCMYVYRPAVIFIRGKKLNNMHGNNIVYIVYIFLLHQLHIF